MIRTWLAGPAFAALALGGCEATNRVVFVTDTTLGIGAETAPAQATIGYNRTEGYIAPTYENGALPPVIGFIHTGGPIFAPYIHQLYATGEASLCAARKSEDASCKVEPPLIYKKDEKKLAFFGTVTSVAVRVSYAATPYINPVPDSFSIGYKRKEFSFFPVSSQKIGEEKESGENKKPADILQDFYPAALARIETNLNLKDSSGTSFENGQFIATGAAATALASQVKQDFVDEIQRGKSQHQVEVAGSSSQ